MEEVRGDLDQGPGVSAGSQPQPQPSPADDQGCGEPHEEDDRRNEGDLLAGVVGDLEVGEPGDPVEGEGALTTGKPHGLPDRERLAEGLSVAAHLCQVVLVEGEHRLRNPVAEP